MGGVVCVAAVFVVGKEVGGVGGVPGVPGVMDGDTGGFGGVDAGNDVNGIGDVDDGVRAFGCEWVQVSDWIKAVEVEVEVGVMIVDWACWNGDDFGDNGDEALSWSGETDWMGWATMEGAGG